MPGYSSVTLWTPSKDFGVAIVANAVYRGNAVINLIAIRAFEEHFGIPHQDWEARYVTLYKSVLSIVLRPLLTIFTNVER